MKFHLPKAAVLTFGFALGLAMTCALQPALQARPEEIPRNPDLQDWSLDPKDQDLDGFRPGVWSLSLQAMQYGFASGGGEEFQGFGTVFSIGRGFIYDTWWLDISVDVYSGPWVDLDSGQLEQNTLGGGLSVWAGYSLYASPLRSQSFAQFKVKTQRSESAQQQAKPSKPLLNQPLAIGLGLGLRLAQISTESLGLNRRSYSSTPPGSADAVEPLIVDRYNLQASMILLEPEVFFGWLQPGRPKGSASNLLRTRIEGVFVHAGISLPVRVSYRLEEESRGRPSSYAGLAEDLGGSKTSQSGNMQGVAFYLRITTLLGI